MPKPFQNEPILDYSRAENRRKMERALARVRKQLGREYPLVIGGKNVRTGDKLRSLNPAEPDQVVAVFNKADISKADQAMKAALRAFETWRFTPARERANVLFKAARIMRRRRFELNAWMVFEVGKNFTEADADVAETIDFLEFYGREMLRYAARQPVTPVKGEKNMLEYIPLGVGIVIPPWNFPLAILVGMTSAAIVSGNTVILKPSSDSPMMGWLATEILREAGVPDGVLNFLPGPGSSVGDYLVKHPKTRFISFTGSMEVGLRINEMAARMSPGQIWIKRVVAEMGGKDAIIVDAEADIDDAVNGVLTSAFGFQGQKCSACSRAIIDQKVYKEFTEKLVAKVKEITVDDPVTNAYMGPVINKAAQQNILKYIKIGLKEKGKLLTGGEKIDRPGWFIQPTVIGNVKPNHTIAQEEIFGPVLALIKAKDYDNALKIANGTIYGLTGSVYTNNPDKMERARREFHVGNLYFNRKCTGALVGGHPFGGFNMSGTDSKAGGRDYLLLFMQAKSVSRKLK
ncbi:MAG: L-glutamate gamma-semialdehyde dehydrogenase [Chlorobi bacterium]|nr:L-glutamate gamma-semialdehyde dehydrogenase [Chlorobiota bacterium]